MMKNELSPILNRQIRLKSSVTSQFKDIKIKNFSTEKELKDELIKKSKSNPWMSRVVAYLFEW